MEVICRRESWYICPLLPARLFALWTVHSSTADAFSVQKQFPAAESTVPIWQVPAQTVSRDRHDQLSAWLLWKSQFGGKELSKGGFTETQLLMYLMQTVLSVVEIMLDIFKNISVSSLSWQNINPWLVLLLQQWEYFFDFFGFCAITLFTRKTWIT